MMIDSNKQNSLGGQMELTKQEQETVKTLALGVKHFGLAETMKYANDNGLLTDAVRNALATK